MLFDIQGHRGCRGLFPENTIPAFLHAVKLGVTTLELDVAISKDHQVVVSHEPWMNPLICSDPDGNPIEGSGMLYNLYQLNYDEIKKYDCGKKGHPRFPQQQKIPAYKPLLSEMIDAVETFIHANNLPEVYFNIETKCLPAGDELFHPQPELFMTLLYGVLQNKNVLHRSNIQSFDYRTLKYLHQHDPSIRIAMLVHDDDVFEIKLDELGFTPQIYSPYYKMVDEHLIEKCHQHKMKIIPWTVNEKDEMIQLKNLGVDGLISDYPDVAISL